MPRGVPFIRQWPVMAPTRRERADRPMTFELLVHHATQTDVMISDRGLALVGEALEELEAEADKYDLHSRAVVTPAAMAKFVVERELEAA
jgi:hypothetical protein